MSLRSEPTSRVAAWGQESAPGKFQAESITYAEFRKPFQRPPSSNWLIYSRGSRPKLYPALPHQAARDVVWGWAREIARLPDFAQPSFKAEAIRQDISYFSALAAFSKERRFS